MDSPKLFLSTYYLSEQRLQIYLISDNYKSSTGPHYKKRDNILAKRLRLKNRKARIYCITQQFRTVWKQMSPWWEMRRDLLLIRQGYLLNVMKLVQKWRKAAYPWPNIQHKLFLLSIVFTRYIICHCKY